MSLLLNDLAQDLRFAARSLRRDVAVATLAVLTLAVGIGATTAIFSVVNAALLRPLPFAKAEELMKVVLRMPRQDISGHIDMTWSYPKYLAFYREQDAFSGVAIYIHQSVTVGGTDGEGQRVPGESISAQYLRVLGVQPILGSPLHWQDDGPPPPPAVLLSHGYWRSVLGADPAAVGRPLEVNGQLLPVAGVLPEGFRGLTGRADLFIPIPVFRANSMGQVAAHQYDMIARRAPAVSAARAKDVTRAMGDRLAELYPTSGDAWRAAAYTLDEVRLDPVVRQAILIVTGAVVLLLLIACVNLAGLLLGRSAARRREIAIRIAIGARRGRLVRQLLTESLLLAALGALGGLAVAWAGVRALAELVPQGGGDFAGAFSDDFAGLTTIALRDLRIDGAALAFTAAVAVLAGLLFGLLPALQSTRKGLAGPMRAHDSAEPAFAGIRRLTARGLLVVGQVALAVVLLVASGLMVRSLDKLLDVPLGYREAGVLSARLSFGGTRYTPETAGALWDELLERLRSLPGVASVGAASCAPLSTECEGTSIGIAADVDVPVGLHGSSPGYFRALGIPLLDGRDFTDADRAESPRVLIVNQAAVREYWGGDSPIGRRVAFWGDTAEVVGVVGDVRYDKLHEKPRPAVYLPFSQRPFRSAVVFVKGTIAPASLTRMVRQELHGLGPGNVLYDAKPMRERLHHAASRTSFTATVLAVFAGVALLLASIGIYGVMALAVVQRRREIGVRMALGARASGVVAMLVRQGMLLAVLGGAIGGVLALMTAQALDALLFGVSGMDPVTYAAMAAALGLIALAATVIPARRALRVSIVQVLKSE